MSKRNAAKLPAVFSAGTGIRLVGGRELEVDQVHFVDAVHPKGTGPWELEADKLAWTDPHTGYGCIVLRSERTGALGAYVGVDPGHPLHGFEAAALSAAFDIQVHGGVTYAVTCQPGPESRSICHTPASARRVHGRAAHVESTSHDDHRWWFGCTADHPYDLLPPITGNGRQPERVDEALTRPPEYRTEAYMVEQATSLAAQLDAIATGRPMPEIAALPPVGVDPRRSREER
jgi:hypothetical protein